MKTKIHNFKSNKKFWEEKIRRNIKRDKEVTRQLRKDNWKVIRFWDFQINKDAGACARKVLREINKSD
jgi:DNA mismatch endonuclease (patch repair protein)